MTKDRWMLLTTSSGSSFAVTLANEQATER